MINCHGVRIDDDPADGEPSEIWIHYPDIVKICEEHAIEPRALQAELDARGLTSDRVQGVSDRTYVHGQREAYWILDAAIADPAHYEPDPESVMERVESAIATDDENVAVGDEDEDVGLIGSTDPTILGDGSGDGDGDDQEQEQDQDQERHQGGDTE